MNRAGVGLIELVSEPEIETPKEASLFVQRIHEIFQDLKICTGNLEQGAMRIDVNVNLVNEETGVAITPRVELKNINGIGVIEAAVNAELKRQEDNLKNSKVVLKKETRFYSPETDETILLRSKTESYRYLPEYDLPTYNTNSFDGITEDEDLPLTRHEIIENYQKEYPQLKQQDLLRLWTRPDTLPSLFHQCLPLVTDQRFLLNWIVGELLAILNRENLEIISFTPKTFAKLVENVKDGKIDKEISKSELVSALKESRDLVIKESIDNYCISEVNKEIDSLFNLYADRVAFLRSPEGQKRGSIDFFIGPLMKKFRGKITANELTELLNIKIKL